MSIRVLVFEDDKSTRELLSTALRLKGYEVLDFPAPITCAVVAENSATCSRDAACADILITDMNMPGMSGLELVHCQMAKGCKIPSRNKLVISANLTPEQEGEFREFGFSYIRKPFHLSQVLDWVSNCKENIPPGRKLVPIEELLKSTQASRV